MVKVTVEFNEEDTKDKDKKKPEIKDMEISTEGLWGGNEYYDNI